MQFYFYSHGQTEVMVCCKDQHKADPVLTNARRYVWLIPGLPRLTGCGKGLIVLIEEVATLTDKGTGVPPCVRLYTLAPGVGTADSVWFTHGC